MMDRTVFCGLLPRIAQLLFAPINVYAMASMLSPELQGYYYSFASLAALQAFFELGLQNVIVYFGAHEWAHLKLEKDGNITGNEMSLGRLAGLATFAGRWYGWMGIFYFVLVSCTGFYFFSQNDAKMIAAWEGQWLCYVFFMSVILSQQPRIALLESCGQINFVNGLRTFQVVVGSALQWWSFYANFGLGAICAGPIVVALSNEASMYIFHRDFFASLKKAKAETSKMFRKEIFSFQWRIAITASVAWFLYSIYVPIVFHYWGPVAAGQVGLTLQVVEAIFLVSATWVDSKFPRLCIHAAQGNRKGLFSDWTKNLFVSLVVFLIGSGIFLWSLSWICLLIPKLDQRFLPAYPTILFLCACFVRLLIRSLAAFIRAHKSEAVFVGATAWCVANGILVWQGTRSLGINGAAYGSLFAAVFIGLPLIGHCAFGFARRESVLH